ncbi:cytochrome P450 [Colletotrichum melonis]|uniref:Cytochrome P450 n=1 Tax=Colletotrichum melonis TaxID=1209925 RepID=A0AAI9XNP9_9PEZI|nr:cytochrome P450 [Colletotrichum melonis]
MDAKTIPDASMAANHATVGAPVVEALSLRPLFMSMFFILLCITFPVLNIRSKLTKFPDVAVSTSIFDIDGFAKASGSRDGYHSPKFVVGIRNEADLDFMPFVNQVWAIASVRVKITQSLGKVTVPLADECDQACREIFGESKEQKEAVLKSALLKLVARTSSRVFLGDVGCRNPAWLNITKEFTVNNFMAWVGSGNTLLDFVTLSIGFCQSARLHAHEDKRHEISSMIF